MVGLAIGLALSAALCQAVGSVLQQHVANAAPQTSGLRLQLVAHLLRRRVWLVGVFLGPICGSVLHIMALNYGQISLVQPILIVELVFMIIVRHAWSRLPIGHDECTGALAIVVGLGTFLYVANPTAGIARPSQAAWLEAVAAGLVAVVVAIAYAQKGSQARRALLYGVAAAVAWALTAGFIKATTAVVHHGWLQLFLHWPLYAVAVVGGIGFWAEQNAYHVGPLTASQPVMIMANLVLSVTFGVWLFNDHLAHSASSILIEAIALLVTTAGVLRLASLPVGATMRSAASGQTERYYEY
jgi:hypothetical protein